MPGVDQPDWQKAAALASQIGSRGVVGSTTHLRMLGAVLVKDTVVHGTLTPKPSYYILWVWGVGVLGASTHVPRFVQLRSQVGGTPTQTVDVLSTAGEGASTRLTGAKLTTVRWTTSTTTATVAVWALVTPVT